MQNESIKVFIVQDSPRADVQLDAVLTASGFAIRTVSDSASALGTVEVWRPSVAIVDLRSPAGEGQRFCAAIAGRPEEDQLPLVLVGEGPNLLKATAVIPSGLVATPIDHDHLVASVLRVARGTRGAPLPAR